MFATIFTDLNYAQIVHRLQLLQADSPRQWGTMTVAEMLRHCRAQLDFILHPDPHTRLHGKLFQLAPVRWLALYAIPWPKGSPTAPEMDVRKQLKDTADFATERQVLLDRLHTLYHAAKADAVHPLFGRMGRTQWGRVVWKHLDHHLRQFGC